ncbi:class I SAM-dependent methyltransferase [Legionella impletisoli]|uniref:Methyltransferase n=1 Tax=Legionella impletisoli TaxID=343510 RepID=A0A917NFS7_9GAMM|nr:class I SAM-dependent methyltransferase [Legionella impletisoli]GGI93603.1 methyltransferase [Legionella impletisoli]
MVSNKEWPAEDYAIGSYIQATVALRYLNQLTIQSQDGVLDIGCGDGSFSLKILEKFPMASFIGLDASENMLILARKNAKSFPQAQFIKGDITEMTFSERFNYVVSFWCLQWTHNILLAFQNIFDALKPGGKLLTIFPTGDDAFMTTFLEVKKSRQFPELETFVSPVNYKQLEDLGDQLEPLPFRTLKVERHHQSLTLPSLDTFRKFVRGVSFYQGQISPDIIPQIQEAMVNVFAEESKKKYQGELRFEFSNYCVTGEK